MAGIRTTTPTTGAPRSPRITLTLDLPAIKAAPVKPRRVDGTVVRCQFDGHLSRAEIARWPHSIRPATYYPNGKDRIRVPI